MSIDENISEELTLEMSLEEMALEVIDMLGVALFSEQMDKFYAKLPEDANYGQEEMIGIIKSLKKDYPQFFIKT